MNVELNLFAIHRLEKRRPVRNEFTNARLERIVIHQIGESDGRRAAHLVGVARTDTAGRCPDAFVAAGRALAELIFELVVGHDQMGAVADAKSGGRVNPASAQSVDLKEQCDRIDDDAGSDDTGHVVVQDAGRKEVQREGLFADADGVPGVGAAVESNDEVKARAEVIDDLALALVAPPEAEYTRMSTVRRSHRVAISRRLPHRLGAQKRGHSGPAPRSTPFSRR